MRAALVAALVVALPGVALANDAAEKLFREARAEMSAGNYAAACPKFEESQRIEPAPGTLMNLADCEEKLGQMVQARNDFALAASGFPRDDPRRPFVLQHAADLEKRFAHLTLRLAPGAPPDAMVRRGALMVDRSALGTAVDVDPGTQHIVVTAPGHVDRAYTLHMGESESTELIVDAGPLAPTKTIVKTLMVTTKEPAHPRRVAGIVIGILGLGAVGVGVGAGIVAMGDANDVTAHCSTVNACDARGFGAAREGRVAAPLSTAMLIGGGGFVLSGLMLIWGSAGHARASIAPAVGSGSAVLMLRGAF